MMSGARRMAAGLVTAAALALSMAGCDSADKPYVKIEGGGFIFNYRVAEAFYGVSLKPMRRLDPGTVLEVAFEDPAGGALIVVRETVSANRLAYMLRTPGVSGVRKDRPYHVEVRVIAPGGTVLARYPKTFTSNIDQTVLPKRPLTIGPGYTRNPDRQ